MYKISIMVIKKDEIDFLANIMQIHIYVFWKLIVEISMKVHIVNMFSIIILPFVMCSTRYMKWKALILALWKWEGSWEDVIVILNKVAFYWYN
jgi:hypothetical protein